MDRCIALSLILAIVQINGIVGQDRVVLGPTSGTAVDPASALENAVEGAVENAVDGVTDATNQLPTNPTVPTVPTTPTVPINGEGADNKLNPSDAAVLAELEALRNQAAELQAKLVEFIRKLPERLSSQFLNGHPCFRLMVFRFSDNLPGGGSYRPRPPKPPQRFLPRFFRPERLQMPSPFSFESDFSGQSLVARDGTVAASGSSVSKTIADQMDSVTSAGQETFKSMADVIGGGGRGVFDFVSALLKSGETLGSRTKSTMRNINQYGTDAAGKLITSVGSLVEGTLQKGGNIAEAIGVQTGTGAGATTPASG